jgi:translocation and assembly module TamB
VLRRGAEQANFGALAGLQRGKLLDNSPITATVNVRNFSVADLQGLAGFDVPVTGVLNATVQVGGTRADPRGSGRMAITKGTLYGEAMQAINADLERLKKEVGQ